MAMIGVGGAHHFPLTIVFAHHSLDDSGIDPALNLSVLNLVTPPRAIA